MTGALVPHAPLLLPEVASHPDELRDIWDAFNRLRIPDDGPLIVLTPHADATGVYARNEGSLAGFGVPGVSATVPSEPIEHLSLPTIDEPLDHGALVPLVLLGMKRPVTVVGLSGSADISKVVEQVRTLATDRDVFLLVSAHTSARLTERAPLPYSFDAMRLDSRLVGEIEEDCVALQDAAQEMESVGGSCSRPTLQAFGELFAGAEGSVLAYGFPFGVGYLVITAHIDV